MSAEVTVRVSCDAPGCLAYREVRTIEASAATVRLTAIDNGWEYFEGDDRCPRHPFGGAR